MIERPPFLRLVSSYYKAHAELNGNSVAPPVAEALVRAQFPIPQAAEAAA